ncbi:MAG TPA: hypothetical protein VM120_28485 [Bryobacteraceae bacterium]|nr:hypothetical protein [Bryobacteraceae bacterium]
MSEDNATSVTPGGIPEDVRSLIRQVVREMHTADKEKSEPAHKAELHEERRRREQLERRVNELVAENQKSRTMAEEAERNGAIRAEFQKQGVTKLELAFKAVKDEVRRTSDGRLVASNGDEDVSLAEFVKQFVQENPELLPARLSGGSGAASGSRPNPPAPQYQFDIDKIRPGMNRDDLERIREEVARIAQQSLSGR